MFACITDSEKGAISLGTRHEVHRCVNFCLVLIRNLYQGIQCRDKVR